MKRRLIAFGAVALLALTAACAAEKSDKPELDGYCPVAYHKMHKAVKGNAQNSATYAGKTYYFVKAAARDAFVKNPEMFLPVYGSSCTVCTKAGMNSPADPKYFSIYKKKLYLFASAEHKQKFDKDPDSFVKVSGS